jgi:hypothetical protein
LFNYLFEIKVTQSQIDQAIFERQNYTAQKLAELEKRKQEALKAIQEKFAAIIKTSQSFGYVAISKFWTIFFYKIFDF